MRYKAGDKVWANCHGSPYEAFGIAAAVVEGPAELDHYWKMLYGAAGVGQWYRIDIEGRPCCEGGYWIIIEKRLSPRDEDGRQAGSWENSVTVYRPPGKVKVKSNDDLIAISGEET